MARSELSAREATRVALSAQALRGPRPKIGVGALVEHLRAIQLDTISVLARSHELVAYARLGAITRSEIEDAYWGASSATFEYWSHAACLVPLAAWPAYGVTRRARAARGYRWHRAEDLERTCDGVVRRLREDGPLSSRELGGAKAGGEWWQWSKVKIAAEWLLDTGVVVCRTRRGFERVYDLAERVIPSVLLEQELDDEECTRQLVESAGRALGVATIADLASYHGLRQSQVRSVVDSTSLRRVRVEGWGAAYLARDAESALEAGLRNRTVMLSPFDSLLWDRRRFERLFGVTYRLEAYVPAPKRVVGYFAMPVLAKERIVALVDPKRVGTTLHVRHVFLYDERAIREIARAITLACGWVGGERVEVDRVTPSSARDALRTALRH